MLHPLGESKRYTYAVHVRVHECIRDHHFEEVPFYTLRYDFLMVPIEEKPLLE
jgi:hypothetical protein